MSKANQQLLDNLMLSLTAGVVLYGVLALAEFVAKSCGAN